MFNIKFCVLLVIGIFLVFSASVLGQSCEINTTSTQFVPYNMGGMTLFTMPEYLSTDIGYRVDLVVSNNNCSDINNTVNITVSICRDSCKIYEFYNRTLQKPDYIIVNSHFSLPEKQISYSQFDNQLKENQISFPEEGNYTINFKFFNNKNEIQYNYTIKKKVSLLENNIILFSSLSSIIFSGVNLILTIAIILLSSLSFIEIFTKMYVNIFKKIEDGDYDTALKNILKPLFYLYSLYLFTSFLIILLFSPAEMLSWISSNIEWFIILFAFYSLLFTRKLRNHNIISLLFALYFLGTFIHDITTNFSNKFNNESLFRDGFFGIIITYSSMLIAFISGAVFILSFLSIIVKLFFIVKIDFRNKIKECENLIWLLPDFISFYLAYVILTNYYYLQEIIHANFNPYNIWIIFTFFLLIANILIKRIIEIEKQTIRSLYYYIISFILLYLSLFVINGIRFTVINLSIFLITVIWFYYIFIIYSRNISSFIHKHFSRFHISSKK